MRAFADDIPWNPSPTANVMSIGPSDDFANEAHG